MTGENGTTPRRRRALRTERRRCRPRRGLRIRPGRRPPAAGSPPAAWDGWRDRRVRRRCRRSAEPRIRAPAPAPRSPMPRAMPTPGLPPRCRTWRRRRRLPPSTAPDAAGDRGDRDSRVRWRPAGRDHRGRLGHGVRSARPRTRRRCERRDVARRAHRHGTAATTRPPPPRSRPPDLADPKPSASPAAVPSRLPRWRDHRSRRRPWRAGVRRGGRGSDPPPRGQSAVPHLDERRARWLPSDASPGAGAAPWASPPRHPPSPLPRRRRARSTWRVFPDPSRDR